jgi:catechol 2,3-dioxygenase-like lactoylglutathione lyase family enzyme
MHVAGMSHVALTVTDLDSARTFWTQVMGFAAAMESAGLIVFVDVRSQVTISCVVHESGEPGPFDERRVGLDHLAFQIDTVDELRAWAARLGVPTTSIVESPFGSHLNLRGPENLAIELLVMAPAAREALSGGGARVARPAQ